MTVDTSAAPPGARNATLADIAVLLRDQQALKADFVVPAAAIRARGGLLAVDDSAPVLGPDGVTMTAGMYTPTGVCDQGIADKLGIPGAYLRRMREQRPDLYDANVNGWLEGDGRKFLLRCLRAGGPAGAGSRGRSCPTGTSSSTTWMSCWPRSTGSASPGSRSRWTGVT